jgi:hypothetical protein
MVDGGFLGSTLATWGGTVFLILLSVGIWTNWFFWLQGRRPDVLYAAAGAQLLTLAQIILSQLALGFLGWLFPFPLALLNILFSAGFFLIFVRPHRTAGALQLGKWFACLRKAHFPHIGKLFVALFLFILLRSLLQAFFLPPREWDGLVYHLPIMGAFYQAHAIRPLESMVVWVRSYPFNGELLSLWNLIFLGVDKFVDMPFLATIAFAALAVYGLVRRRGAGREAAFLGSAVFAFGPVMILQQVSTSSDAFLASVFAMGVFAIQPHAPDEPEERQAEHFPAQVLLCGLAMGILAGTKYSGLFYAAGLGLLYLVRLRGAGLWRTHAWTLRKSAGTTLLAIGAAFSLCGYPYLRNIVLFQNPIAPFQVQLSGWTLFPGDRERGQIETDNTLESDLTLPTTLRVARLWMEPYDTIYNNKTSGLGPLWICLAVPAILPWLYSRFRVRDWFSVALSVSVLLAWLATPAFWVGRYAAPILLLGSIAAAWIGGQIGTRLRKVLEIAVLACMAFLTLVTMDMGPVETRILWNYAVRQTDATRTSVPFLWLGRDAFEYIDEKTRDHPSRIVYSGLVRFIYPLYGPDFHNTVLDLPAVDRENWQRDLDLHEIEYVLVVRGKPQLDWTAGMTTYRQVLEDDNYVLFERIQET